LCDVCCAVGLKIGREGCVRAHFEATQKQKEFKVGSLRVRRRYPHVYWCNSCFKQALKLYINHMTERGLGAPSGVTAQSAVDCSTIRQRSARSSASDSHQSPHTGRVHGEVLSKVDRRYILLNRCRKQCEHKVVRVDPRQQVRPLIHSLVGKAEQGSGPTTRRAYASLAVLHSLLAVLHVLALPHDGVGGFALTESHGDTNQFIGATTAKCNDHP
jgi:hypothetical protein